MVKFTVWCALLFVACFLIVRNLMQMRSLGTVRSPAPGGVAGAEDAASDSG